MKNYYRVMLGKGSEHAAACFAGNFIGADFCIDQDLSGKLPDEWREFNAFWNPVFMQANPGKSKIAAGLACGSLWMVARGIERGELVVCPDGSGNYRAAEVLGDYAYVPGGMLPHRRTVKWLDAQFSRAEASDVLRNSLGANGTVIMINHHQEEIDRLLGKAGGAILRSTDDAVEDPSAFAMEMHLEHFLIANWSRTILGREFDVLEEDGELIGKQFTTDTGRIDILAVSKDRKRLLVVELKKGRASDVVVGQIMRYMGYVQEELAEPGQTVEGVIIAHEDDTRIRRALTLMPSIKFFRYQVSFQLVAD
jgi:restriction system protein